MQGDIGYNGTYKELWELMGHERSYGNSWDIMGDTGIDGIWRELWKFLGHNGRYGNWWDMKGLMGICGTLWEIWKINGHIKEIVGTNGNCGWYRQINETITIFFYNGCMPFYITVIQVYGWLCLSNHVKTILYMIIPDDYSHKVVQLHRFKYFEGILLCIIL